MIIEFLILLAFVIVETQLWSASLYLIVSLVIVANKGLVRSLGPIIVAGIILDVLAPRHLGVTPLVVMLVLLGIHILQAPSWRDDLRYLGLSLVLVVLEGLLAGRGVWSIVASLVIAVVVLWGGKVLANPGKEIIVRRQI
jgi:hypothetical protein